MELEDTREAAEFRHRARSWLADNAHLAPHVAAAPSPSEVARWRAWSRALYKAGFAGIAWPIEAGGLGLPYAYLEVWLSECARAGVPDHFGVIGIDMAGPTINVWGSPEQKRRFLPPLLAADEIWCQGFSEPESGSDVAAARTRAVLDGDEWVINGHKVWSSFAQWADWCILIARTEPDLPKHKGLSFFLVPMSAPGVAVRPLPQITGDPEFNEITFTDVRIPRDSMLGGRGDGWRVTLTTLDFERSTHGIALSAQLQSEFERVRTFLQRPRADGSRPVDDAELVDRFVRLWVDSQALRLTNLRSVSELDRAKAPGSAGTISKLRWSELNQQLAGLAVEALGLDATVTGRDAVDDGHWAYSVLRTRGNTIEAGTSEVLRNIIAERVLGLPRSR